MVTLKQIASRCNVSITTVSRVLSNDQSLSVSKDTRDLIQHTANVLGYTKKQNIYRDTLHIGVILWYDTKQEFDDPYFMEIRHGIERQSKEKGLYIMTIYREDGKFNLSQLTDIDGIIAVGKFTEAEIRSFEKKSTSIVFVDSSPKPLKYDSVVIDYEEAVSQVLEYIIESGYSKIGYIGAHEKIGDIVLPDESRERFFKNYLYKRNLYMPEHVHIGEFTSKSGYSLIQKAIQQGLLAEVYFCANDSIAMGAIKALHEANIDIPNKVAVIGFNDIAQAKYIYPSLTTLKVETTTMGEEALLSLLDRIENNKKIAIKKIIPTTLIKRQSA